ncbi:STAS domain-containing protein [Metallibacterium scheffleri]|uniref:STAS domain-containing protein n=1 Tax=Metallibacterium scheffleri TaxID=993689 RepID=UPI0023F29142|nr:STAS domain-containing protein [Metallibacterium scheffleri]
MSVAGLEVSVDGDALRLSGRLDFANAAAAYRAISTRLVAGIVRIDLSALGQADSATLACLLAWRAQSERAGRMLVLSALPESLHALAQVSGVDGLLQEVTPAAV